MPKSLSLSARCGRIRLTLKLFRMGDDVQIHLSGGQAHIGAVALAGWNAATAHTTVPTHREGELALRMAQSLSDALRCTVCVSAGIHFDSIRREEIRSVEELADALTQRCLTMCLACFDRTDPSTAAHRSATSSAVVL